jgi:NADPH-dependent ferric siderophore reductase
MPVCTTAGYNMVQIGHPADLDLHYIHAHPTADLSNLIQQLGYQAAADPLSLWIAGELCKSF